MLGGALYTARVTTNPPGFYIDESSIAYNAYTLSQRGRDEHGNHWPLFFRAFGDYKNPTSVYLLAALFKLTGPSILAARLLSAVAGLAAALLLGLLARRLTMRDGVAVLVALSALLTPWLFENSRTVLEVALYPLATVLFLLAVRRASERESWGLFEALSLSVTLALLTYTYTIGRLFGPLLAFGLILFMTRARRRGVCLAWLAYLVTLIPLFIFVLGHPGALTARFGALTYAGPQASLPETVGKFVRHYLGNISPWRLLVAGGTDLRDHVPVMGMLLGATLAVAALGLFLIVRHNRRDAWWRFIIYGLAAAVVPASLTDNDFPILRLIAFPIFILVLTIPAWAWLWETGRERLQDDAASSSSPSLFERYTIKRPVLLVLIVLTVAQGALFQWLYHQRGTRRGYIFDSHYARVLQTALFQGSDQIYLEDRPGAAGYIQAFWHATLLGADTARFRRLSAGATPPDGAVVISTVEQCSDCQLLLKSINYIVYRAQRDESGRLAATLPDGQYRARLSIANPPATLRPGQQETLRVLVENLSETAWSAQGSGDGRYAVTLRNLWQRSDGTLLTDRDGASMLPADLGPGPSVSLLLKVTAPETPGDYTLLIDLAQANSSWFFRPENLDEYVYELDPPRQDITWFHERGAEPMRLRVWVR